MPTFKKYLTRPLCLALSLALLGGAAVMALLDGLPYERLKDAADHLLTQGLVDNYRYSAEIYVDGAPFLSYTEVTKSGDKTQLWRNLQTGAWRYETDVLRLDKSDTGGGWGGYTYQYPGHKTYAYSFNLEWEYSQKTAQAQLITRLADTALANYKGELTMTKQNGEHIVAGEVGGERIPELYDHALASILAHVTSYDQSYSSYREWVEDGTEYIEGIWLRGLKKDIRVSRIDKDGYLELIDEQSIEATREDYTDHPFKVPIESAVIDHISVETAVDNDGRPLDGTLTGRAWMTNIFGETHYIQVILRYSIREDDVITPDCPVTDFNETALVDTLYSLVTDRDRMLIDRNNLTTISFEFGTDETDGIIPETLAVTHCSSSYSFGYTTVVNEMGEDETLFDHYGLLLTLDEVQRRIDEGDEDLEWLITYGYPPGGSPPP